MTPPNEPAVLDAPAPAAPDLGSGTVSDTPLSTLFDGAPAPATAAVVEAPVAAEPVTSPETPIVDPAKAAEPVAVEPAKVEAPVAEPKGPAPLDWESKENPYRQRKLDTERWAGDLSRENKSLKAQLDIINKKLDGTYDPAVDTVPEPTTEERIDHAKTVSKVDASLVVARQQFGDDAVNKLLLDPEGPYLRLERADPAIFARVMASPVPMLEAMTVVREHAFYAKYGTRDPDRLHAAIKQEVLTAERTAIEADVTKKFEARLKLKDAHPTALEGVRGGEAPAKSNGGPATKTLSAIFG